MLELNSVTKTYQLGGTAIHALRGISLKVEPGDFIAIMGPSGSGKSTLMHILGLLDAPDSGSYRFNGKEVRQLSEIELAIYRRDSVGFIFQQFNLLARTTAIDNVCLPLLYSKRYHQLKTAHELLDKVGLGNRIHHKPNELSGGQQQRVAIARALINSPHLLLADEPTGNLDSASSNEIMAILDDLNRQGITIIIVTHEEEIGNSARRLIRMRDGIILSDERTGTTKPQTINARNLSSAHRYHWMDIWAYFKQALRSLRINKIRTGLSMLGILIGVAAVVAMMALGRGAQQSIEQRLSSLGSNLLVLQSGGRSMGAVSLATGSVTRLTLDDAAAIKEQIPTVRQAVPIVNGRAQVTFLNKNWNTQIVGVAPAYATMRAAIPVLGRFISDDDNRRRNRVAVIGATLVRELFDVQEPLGETIRINKVPFQVIGILPQKGSSGWRDQDDTIVIPGLTAMYRLLGKTYVDSIDIEVISPADLEPTQGAILDLIYSRHRVPKSEERAFQVHNMAEMAAALASTSQTMSLLLACIAAISLLVGGIGIMNIMLVSVTERTREIGLRKAIGARSQDILFQFLVESMVVTGIGGSLGIALGAATTGGISLFLGWTTSISFFSIALAFCFSAGIGIVFGIYPAKKASLLHPIDALRHE